MFRRFFSSGAKKPFSIPSGTTLTVRIPMCPSLEKKATQLINSVQVDVTFRSVVLDENGIERFLTEEELQVLRDYHSLKSGKFVTVRQPIEDNHQT